MTSPAPTLYPLMRFRDAPAAIEFLQQAFGFAVRQIVPGPDGMILHAELSYGPGVLMIGSDRDDPRLGHRAGLGWIYVAVEDADAHCERARAAGAEIVAEPYHTDYGSRDYTARDPEGNQWHFGTYRPSAELPAPDAPGTIGASGRVRPQPLLAVADVPAASRWYQRLLGASSGHGGEEYERLLVDGELIMQLHHRDVHHHHGPLADPAAPTGNGVAVWFALDDFDAAVARSRQMGARVELDVHVNPNAQQRELWLRDLDGYLVVLAERTT